MMTQSASKLCRDYTLAFKAYVTSKPPQRAKLLDRVNKCQQRLVDAHIEMEDVWEWRLHNGML